MKKILLSLGATSAVVAPIAVAVSCGETKSSMGGFTSNVRFINTKEFAKAAVMQLKNKDVTMGVNFSINGKSFNTYDGGYITALTAEDVSTADNFVAWVNKLDGYNTALKAGLAEYDALKGVAQKATWIRNKANEHPRFAEMLHFGKQSSDPKAQFDFQSKDDDDTVQIASEAIEIYNNIADVLVSLDEELTKYTPVPPVVVAP